MRRAVLSLAAANALLALGLIVLASAAGGYGLEHVARDSAAADLLDVVTVALLVAGILAIVVLLTGRPRAIGNRRVKVGLLALAVVWPLAYAALLASVAVEYPGHLMDVYTGGG